MAFTPKFFGTIVKGMVRLNHPKVYEHFLRCFKEGTEVEVTVRRKQRKKSNRQLNYYRGVVVPFIAREIGESNDRTHELLQPKFFMYRDDKGRPYIRSTRLDEWGSGEWEEKVQEIREWAHDYFSSPENPNGLQIPLPNEVEY